MKSKAKKTNGPKKGPARPANKSEAWDGRKQGPSKQNKGFGPCY
jgi:hypothetical protein